MAGKSLPIDLQNATAFLEVDSETWRAVLDAAGEGERLRGEEITWERLRDSLAATTASDALSDALETILQLGTDDGRDILLEAAEDVQSSLAVFANLPAREFVARVWAASRTEPSLQTMLVRARVTTQEVRQNRHYREFAPKNAERLPTFDKDKLRQALMDWYQQSNDESAVNVFPYERDGEWYCEIIKGDPLKRVVAVEDKILSLLEFRPASSDVIRYDPQTGRIGIATRSRKLLQTYRKLLGTLVAQNEQFFANENICSLNELQKRGRALFDKYFYGIVHVNVTELRWRRGDRDKIWVHGRDCFQLLSDLGASFQEGELIEAKLTIAFTGGGRQGLVSLRAPNVIEINAGTNRELVEKMLDEVGIRGSFDEEDVGKNFWSRNPWRLSAVAFRRIVPSDFDRLVREKTIRRVTLDTTTHPDHPAAAGALDVVNIDPRTILGVSSDPAIPSRSLTTSDVEGYELDFENLATDVARALKLDGQATEMVSGLWLLGRRALTPAVTISVFLATRPVDATTGPMMQSASQGATPLLLAPKCCTCPPGVSAVPCPVPAGPYTSLLGDIIRQLHLQTEIEPHVYLLEDVIVDKARGQVWLNGVLLTDLKPGTHAFKFLEILAKAPGRIVAKQTINDALSASRSDDEAAKQAKKALKQAINNSFTAGARGDFPDFGKLIVAKNGGYTLQATASLVA
jgi:peptidoglycan hydrolase-like protein with peptidoglycan-binding domain